MQTLPSFLWLAAREFLTVAGITVLLARAGGIFFPRLMQGFWGWLILVVVVVNVLPLTRLLWLLSKINGEQGLDNEPLPR